MFFSCAIMLCNLLGTWNILCGQELFETIKVWFVADLPWLHTSCGVCGELYKSDWTLPVTESNLIIWYVNILLGNKTFVAHFAKIQFNSYFLVFFFIIFSFWVSSWLGLVKKGKNNGKSVNLNKARKAIQL